MQTKKLHYAQRRILSEKAPTVLRRLFGNGGAARQERMFISRDLGRPGQQKFQAKRYGIRLNLLDKGTEASIVFCEGCGKIVAMHDKGIGERSCTIECQRSPRPAAGEAQYAASPTRTTRSLLHDCILTWTSLSK